MQSNFKPQPTVLSLEAEFQSILKRSGPPVQQPKRWFHSLLDFLTGKTEISIYQRQTLSGFQQWIVYDSQVNRHSVFESEQAVRVWLEQRHLSSRLSSAQIARKSNTANLHRIVR